MLSRHAVKLSHLSLGLVPEIFDSVYMLMLFDKPFEMIDTVMFELGDI